MPRKRYGVKGGLIGPALPTYRQARLPGMPSAAKKRRKKSWRQYARKAASLKRQAERYAAIAARAKVRQEPERIARVRRYQAKRAGVKVMRYGVTGGLIGPRLPPKKRRGKKSTRPRRKTIAQLRREFAM